MYIAETARGESNQLCQGKARKATLLTIAQKNHQNFRGSHVLNDAYCVCMYKQRL